MSMASCPLVRNSRSSGRPMTSDVTGSSMCSRGIHCRAPISSVPGLLPHQRHVHRVDPVRHPARAAHVLAFHPGGRLARLLLAGLVDRRDHQAAPPPAAPRRPVQAGRREPADLAHRRQRVPRRPVQQPLRPVRRPVPGMLGHRPPVPLRQLADQRGHVLPRLLPRLASARSTPAARPSAQPVSGPPAQPLSWQQQPPSIHLSSQTHDRQAAAPTCAHPHPQHARSDRQWRLPY